MHGCMAVSYTHLDVYKRQPGGTGKTFLINLLLATIRGESNIAVAVASLGIAAVSYTHLTVGGY